MSARFPKLLADLADTFWLVPALMIVVAAAVALGLIRLDRSGMVPKQLLEAWLYDGGATGARTLLGAVASSTIGVAGTVFSITIAALAAGRGRVGGDPRCHGAWTSAGEFVRSAPCHSSTRRCRRARVVAGYRRSPNRDRRAGSARLCEMRLLHLPSGVSVRNGRPVLVVPHIQYDQLLGSMLHMIRQNAAGNTTVLMRQLEVLTQVVSCERDPDRMRSLKRHADLVIDDAERNISAPADLDDLKRRHRAFIAMVERGPLAHFSSVSI